jgi:hypothetical protein
LIGEKIDALYFGREFLITLCGFANAATVRLAHQRHAVVRSNQGMIFSDPASGFCLRATCADLQSVGTVLQ